MLPSNVIANIRVMVHTLVDHIYSFFPDPWSKAMGSESEDSDHGNDSESPNAALKDLAGDLEYVWGHIQKLSQQILRAYGLIRTGKCILDNRN